MEGDELETALDRISSNGILERGDGVKHLIRLLEKDKSSAKLANDKFKDRDFHEIFESVFRCVKRDKASYALSTKPTPKNAAASRLSLAAGALHLAVEVGLTKIKLKTTNAVIDHILDCLPDPDGEKYFQPLTSEYLKALRTILQHAPHREHLQHRRWEVLVDFLCSGINGSLKEKTSFQTSQNQGLSHGSTMSFSQSSRNARSTPLRVSHRQDTQRSSSESTSTLETLIVCLDLLSLPGNNVSFSKAQDIFAAMHSFISSAPSSANALQGAFSAINNVLSKSLTQKLDMARAITINLLPALPRFWSVRSSAVRDQILIALSLGVKVLTPPFMRENVDNLSVSIENILDTLRGEYCRRKERDLLLMDDLAFFKHDRHGPMSLTHFGPRIGNDKSIGKWLLMSTIASLIWCHDCLCGIAENDGGVPENPEKRQRLAKPVKDIMRQAWSSQGIDRIFCLQILPWLLSVSKTAQEEFADHVDQFLLCMNDDDAQVASWVAIGIACFSACDLAHRKDVSVKWPQIMATATRCASIPACSRGTCYLLTMLLRLKLVDSQEALRLTHSTIASDSFSPPPGLSDCSLALYETVIKLQIEISPLSMAATTSNVVRWLSNIWDLRTILDRAYNRQLAEYAISWRLLNLFCACSNRRIRFLPIKQATFSSSIIGQWLRQLPDEGLQHYLLLTNSAQTMEESPMDDARASLVDEELRRRIDHSILETLLIKVKQFNESWQSMRKERTSNVNTDLIQLLTSTCVIAKCYATICVASFTSLSASLRKASDVLWSEIHGFVSRRDSESVQPYLQATLTSLSLRTSCTDDHTLLSMSTASMVTYVYERISGEQSQDFIPDASVDESQTEILDGDENVESQSSQATTALTVLDLSREYFVKEAQLFFSTEEISRYLYLSHLSSNVVETENLTAKAQIIEMLILLEGPDLLQTRLALLTFLANTTLSRSELCILLRHLGEQCLGPYAFNRCEASLCLCVESLTLSADEWVRDPNDELGEKASELYEWLTEDAFDQGFTTPRLLQCVAALIKEVLHIDSNFQSHPSGPSPRTILFKILRHDDNVSKLAAGQVIPDLFAYFVLTEHEAMFADILGALPDNRNGIEGLAIRLDILSGLASRWQTISRSAIYCIFESAASVTAAVPYARRCLESICLARGFPSLKKLFRHFAPHFMHCWLQTSAISSLPFAAFDYASLKDMILDVEPELVAQVAMRCDDGVAQELSRILHVSYRELLIRAFPKAEAYCLARDISLPPSSDPTKKSTETVMRKHVGSDQARTLNRANFAKTFSEMVFLMAQEEQAEKAFSKRPEFSSSLNIFLRINRLGSAPLNLSADQQPSFRTRYILDEIEYLCKRNDIEMRSLWKPSLLVYVARDLFDALTPAHGPFFASTILRKVKVLIALFGTCAFEGYALQMLLRNIQPLLQDFYCSEDAIGLFKFLLLEGKESLQHDYSFICGLATSTFVSMKDFLTSKQESTTQQSHFERTLSSAHEFVRWFARLLDDIDLNGYGPQANETFRNIVSSAQMIRGLSNEASDMYEADLLRTLLQDQARSRPLITQVTFDTIVQFVCRSFKQPAKIRDDIVSDDALATRYAPILWNVLRRNRLTVEFRLWVAQVIGRAYACSGRMNDFLVREHDAMMFDNAKLAPGVSNSDLGIVRKICILLWSDTQGEAGLAERTLQSIIHNLKDQDIVESLDSIVEPSILTALSWTPLPCPSISLVKSNLQLATDPLHSTNEIEATKWSSQLVLRLAQQAHSDPIISALATLVSKVPSFALDVLPFVVHRTLLVTHDSSQKSTDNISQDFRAIIEKRSERLQQHMQVILRTAVYLRQQPFPHEATLVDREKWLSLEGHELAVAAVDCKMYRTALLFTELSDPGTNRTSRRSSVPKAPLPTNLLQEIFEKLEDPDYFYGLSQDTSIGSVINKLQFEGSDLQALSFQSAHHDSILRFGKGLEHQQNFSGIVRALTSANLDGIAYGMCQSPEMNTTDGSEGHIAQTLLNLQEWNLPVANAHALSGAVFESLQAISKVQDFLLVPSILDKTLQTTFESLLTGDDYRGSLHGAISSLAAITELKELWACDNLAELTDVASDTVKRNDVAEFESFKHISLLLSARTAFFSTIRKEPRLQARLHISLRDAFYHEVHSNREFLRMSKKLEAPQPALNSALYLSLLAHESVKIGLDVHAATSSDLAKVFWDSGEKIAAIRMLGELCQRKDLHKQDIPVSRAQMLADVGHYTAEARLENPEKVIDRYLIPAIKDLKGKPDGIVSGRVFHEFASFCDRRLQNPDDLADFARVEKLRHRKEQEVLDLDRMKNAADGKKKEALEYHYKKALPWFNLDDQEYRRLKKIRERLVYQSLENYLLALKACDDYDNDVLRFCALWLDQSGSENANSAVGSKIVNVPSYKFAPLMNQLSSRLLDVKDYFQPLLSDLIARICREHPYHSMYQIFAASKAKHGREDTAILRHAAAGKLAERFQRDHATAPVWIAIHNTSIAYIKFANDKVEEKKQGKIPIRSLPNGPKMETEALKVTTKLPPPTMKVPLRPDCDYRDVPRIAKFEPNVSIASGVSAPKIVTIIGSDGRRYKQLFKGGNDDLRQDAIMEQVFEQVSNLLRDHRATRQRNLGIRTYKVLPLHTNAGIIEFVQNTLPLHDYLLPAHAKYYPKDMKASQCRKIIADAQNRATDQRIQSYRRVTERFNPVMRYFFLERFPNPDEWFVKRLAYSRSTAAISILGHVLGLGDRHGHNILLDETSGEVVHIDLGVAFETGRVLPVPEVVPFRLTRDLIDGMGITQTEGVFRRCCNFTLEALRRESDSIMTILDVLRYDPLYSWSISPVRVRRMQDSQNEGGGAAGAGPGGEQTAPGTRKQDLNEPSEADRALTVVEKKLGKSLSVEATVNELIRQATDERNLAVLYCGWAAYA